MVGLAPPWISCKIWTVWKDNQLQNKKKERAREATPHELAQHPSPDEGEPMGTLAIRQGDVLYFARSLVWRHAIMSSENIDDMPPHERFEAFMKTWNELKATGDFVASQEEADRIAALYKTTAPRVIA